MTVSKAGTSHTDAVLADLIDEIMQKQRRGEPVSLAAYAAEYPDHVQQLQELLPALQALADLSHSACRDGGSRSRAPGEASREGEEKAFRGGTLGDFRILQEIGRGGMGVVYEAEQISLGRRVALKVLPFAAVLDPRHLQRFKNEAQAAAALEHPNIVNVHAVGCERGVHYYAMQFIDGQTLAQVIDGLRETTECERTDKEKGRPGDKETGSVTLSPSHHAAPSPVLPLSPSPRLPLAPSSSPLAPDTSPKAAISTHRSHRTPEFFRSVANLGIQAAEALEHAHQMGVIHRDIKPSNLMVDARGHLWITDFGLAQISAPSPLRGDGRGEGASLTMTGDILGTLRYMSPEQAAGKSRVLDHHTDIYSLGLTLYELLTLRPAFEGDDRQRLVREILETDPPLPRQHNRSIPRDLETIVLKATAKEPSQRYATAQQMADDLRRYLDDKPIRAKRPTLLERAAKWARRHRAATLAAACVCLGLLALGAAAGWYRYQQKAAVERVVGESLAAARAFLQAGDYPAARQQVAEAQGRLSGANWQEGPLMAGVLSVADEVSAAIRGEERFNNFRELLDLIRGSAYHPRESYDTPEKCRTALNLYHVLDDPAWQTRPEFQDLDAHRRTLVEQGALELLFSLGRLEVATGRSYAAADAHRRAIDALRRVEAFHEAVPAAYLWMAESWKALGDEKLASEAAKRARALPARTAVDFYVLGEYQVSQRQYAKALETFQEALHRQPDHYPSFVRLGLCYQMLGRHDLSEAMLTGAIALNPRASIAYYHRGLSRRAQQKFDAASADFTKLVQLNPQDSLGYYAQGLLLNRKGDPAQAIALFDKALHVNPTSFSSHLNRGFAYRRLGQHEKAEADFTRVIEMVKPQVESYPERRNWRDHLALAYMYRGLVRARQPSRYPEALADMEKAIELDPRDALAYTNRGLVRVWTGNLKGAMADYTAALTIDPQSAKAYLGRAQCYLAQKQLQRAAADFRQAAQLAKDPQDLNGAAWFLATCPDAKLRDPQQALSLAEKAVHAGPGRHDYLNTLGVVYYRLGEHTKAIETLQKAIRGDKTGGSPWDFFFLAMAQWQLGHKDEARKWYHQAVEWMEKNKPKDDELLRFRAEAAELLGIGKK